MDDDATFDVDGGSSSNRRTMVQDSHVRKLEMSVERDVLTNLAIFRFLNEQLMHMY